MLDGLESPIDGRCPSRRQLDKLTLAVPFTLELARPVAEAAFRQAMTRRTHEVRREIDAEQLRQLLAGIDWPKGKAEAVECTKRFLPVHEDEFDVTCGVREMEG